MSFNFPSTPATFGGNTSGGTFSFGSTTTASTGIGNAFGAQSNPTGLSFGTTNPTSTSGGLTLGSAGTLFSTTSFPSTTTQPSLFSGFGSTTTSKPSFPMGLNTTSTGLAPTTGFGWSSATPATTSSTGLSFGGFMSTPSSTTTMPTFAGLGTGIGVQPLGGLTATVAPVNVGLGGVSVSQTSVADSGVGSGVGKVDNKAVKEVVVPNEIVTTVDAVKKYIKDQKNIREEITRISSKPLYNVQKETESLKHLLAVVTNGIQRNVAIVEKLKQETAHELQNAEIAQRTRETPPGLQYDNTAPTEYFQNLVAVFETRMQLYRQKIEQMERHLMGFSQCSVFTPKELTLAMKRIHETFVALAAQLQIIHEAVKTQKEQYSNYRKVFYGDATNLFGDEEVQSLNETMQNPRSKFSVGPSPFSAQSNATAAAMASALNRMQQPAAGPPPTLGFSSGTALYPSSLTLGTSFASNANLSNSNLGFASPSSSAIKPLGSSLYDTSVLGSTSNWNSTVMGQKQAFQLQKPPQGSKRGKRVAHNN